MHWLALLLLVLASGAGFYNEALILIGSLAAHEVAHLAVAWVLGLSVTDLIITPFGGMARMDAALELDPQAETSVALAGPFQSFFLAGLALFLTGDQLWDQRLVRFFFETNVSLAFFNLLPALPLDGGRALRGLLSQRWGHRRVTEWMTICGRFIGIAMTATAVIVLIRTGQLFATPLVGGMFLYLGAGREAEAALYRSYGQFLQKRRRLSERRVMAGEQLVVVQGTRLREVIDHCSVRRYYMIVVVDVALRPLGTLYEAELMDAFQELGPEIAVEEILDQ